MRDEADPRRFCRFRQEAEPDSPDYSRLPDDGMCLSVFLLLHPSGRTEAVLAGRVAPQADWRRLGALAPERSRQASSGWMLPASHLRLFEGPDEAARRILAEQLGLDRLPLTGPRVISESYRRDGPANDPHWDLHFLFEGEWPAGQPLAHTAWSELRFIDPAQAPSEPFVRGHADVLALSGRPMAGRG